MVDINNTKELAAYAENDESNRDNGIIIEKAQKLNIVLDMSKFNLFQLCNARYNYRHNCNKDVPIQDKSKALDMGGLLHEGFDNYYTNLKNGMRSFDDRLQFALYRIKEISSDVRIWNSNEDELRIVLATLEENLIHWRYEDENLEILIVEQPFAFVLFEDDYIRIIITGKIDLLVNKKGATESSSYNALPIDHKSMKRDSETLRLANQFECYCYATNSNYLVVNKVGLQKSLKPHEKFKRVPLSYDPIYLEQWKNNTIHVILNQFTQCIATGIWPMNTTACLSFNRRCEYYDICDTSGEEAKLFKLNHMSDANVWDVSSKMTFNGKRIESNKKEIE